MKDEDKKRAWLDEYPVGTKVELRLGQSGRRPAIVEAHNFGSWSVDLQCKCEDGYHDTYYILYGDRQAIERR